MAIESDDSSSHSSFSSDPTRSSDHKEGLEVAAATTRTIRSSTMAAAKLRVAAAPGASDEAVALVQQTCALSTAASGRDLGTVSAAKPNCQGDDAEKPPTSPKGDFTISCPRIQSAGRTPLPLQPGASRVYPHAGDQDDDMRMEKEEMETIDDIVYDTCPLSHAPASAERSISYAHAVGEEDAATLLPGIILLSAAEVNVEMGGPEPPPPPDNAIEALEVRPVDGWYIRRSQGIYALALLVLLVLGALATVLGVLYADPSPSLPAATTLARPRSSVERFAQTLPRETLDILRTEWQGPEGSTDEDWVRQKPWLGRSHAPVTPQGKAWEWLTADPNIASRDSRDINIRFALATFYFATDGPNWRNSTNWLSYQEDVCKWATRRYNEGSAVELCYFEGFAELLLPNNGLVGTIPPELALLTNLFSVRLEFNQLHGTIPAVVWQSWKTIDAAIRVRNNHLHGTIPKGLGSISKLYALDLSGNDFTGTLPTEVGRLAGSITELSFSNNHFTGTLPTELGGLTKVNDLLLSDNSFSGTLPTELGLMDALEKLHVENNRLSGPIPSELGLCWKLALIAAWSNSLTGTIPSELSRLKRLQRLLIQNNTLTGEIPASLAALTALITLDVSSNPIKGSLPSTLGSLSRLTSLHLSQTNLSGRVPRSICRAFQVHDATRGVVIDCKRMTCSCNCSCDS